MCDDADLNLNSEADCLVLVEIQLNHRSKDEFRPNGRVTGHVTSVSTPCHS